MRERREQKKTTSVILNVMKKRFLFGKTNLGLRDVSTYAQHDKIWIFIVVLFISSCSIPKEIVLDKENKSIDLESWRGVPIQTFTGWWVYGEGHHIFKDEETLEEYDLIFPNENMEELVDLYLAVCEMEYFPMECKMTGHLKKEIVTKQTTLIVTDFEILYIQGCGEE